MPFTILRSWSKANAVVQDRFQSIVFIAANIGMSIEHHSHQLLANSLPHEPRLAQVEFKSFLQRDRADFNFKPAHGLFQFLAARKRQVIRIARIPSVE